MRVREHEFEGRPKPHVQPVVQVAAHRHSDGGLAARRGGGADEVACRELVELVTDYLEGALQPAERRRFEAHVAGCDGCRSEAPLAFAYEHPAKMR